MSLLQRRAAKRIFLGTLSGGERGRGIRRRSVVGASASLFLLALALGLGAAAVTSCLLFESTVGYAVKLQAYEDCIRQCYDRGLTDCGCKRPSETK